MNGFKRRGTLEETDTRRAYPTMLWNYMSYIGSRVGVIFACLFVFISGLGMLVNINTSRANSIYNEKFAYNDKLLKLLDMNKHEYYNLLFMSSNAKNNGIEFSDEYVDNYIKDMQVFQGEPGKKLIKEFGENLALNVQIKLRSDAMKHLINKLNQVNEMYQLSKRMPSKLNVSFYYPKDKIDISGDNKNYYNYLVDMLYNEASVLIYDGQQRLGYVLEIDVNKKELVSNVLQRYKEEGIREELYSYLYRQLNKDFVLHKFSSFVFFEENNISDLLFTNDRESIEIAGKIYVPITTNVRSSRIKARLSENDEKLLNNRSVAMHRNDQLIVNLNKLLNKYNAGEIDEEYLKNNFQSYTTNIAITMDSLNKLSMLLGARPGDVFIIGNEAGSDIPAFVRVNSVEYSEEDASVEFIADLLKHGGYLIYNASQNFIK